MIINHNDNSTRKETKEDCNSYTGAGATIWRTHDGCRKMQINHNNQRIKEETESTMAKWRRTKENRWTNAIIAEKHLMARNFTSNQGRRRTTTMLQKNIPWHESSWKSWRPLKRSKKDNVCIKEEACIKKTNGKEEQLEVLTTIQDRQCKLFWLSMKSVYVYMYFLRNQWWRRTAKPITAITALRMFQGTNKSQESR